MKKKLLIAAALLAALVIWLLWADRTVEINEWTIPNEQIPDGFSGMRIAQVSDLHNASFWPRIVDKLEEAQPEIIVMTGDLIDSRRTDLEAALDFVREAVKIAPCYYVNGNHEERVAEWPTLRQGLWMPGSRCWRTKRSRWSGAATPSH